MEIERRWVAGRKYERESDGRALRFKVSKLEADWLKEGRQEGDWTTPMMSALNLTVWQGRSDVKN